MDVGTSANGDKANDEAGSDDAGGGGGGGGVGNRRAFVETCTTPGEAIKEVAEAPAPRTSWEQAAAESKMARAAVAAAHAAQYLAAAAHRDE